MKGSRLDGLRKLFLGGNRSMLQVCGGQSRIGTIDTPNVLTVVRSANVLAGACFFLTVGQSIPVQFSIKQGIENLQSKRVQAHTATHTSNSPPTKK